MTTAGLPVIMNDTLPDGGNEMARVRVGVKGVVLPIN